MESSELKESWNRDGFVVVPRFISDDELTASLGELHEVFPTPDEFHDAPSRSMQRPWIRLSTLVSALSMILDRLPCCVEAVSRSWLIEYAQ